MSRTAQEEANLAQVLAMYREVLIAMNPDKVDEGLSPRYIQHSSLAAPGLDALACSDEEKPDANDPPGVHDDDLVRDGAR